MAETVKLGLSKASADWVAFLESDDAIEPNYLEEKLTIAEKYPDVSVIFNDVNMFGEQDAIDEYTKYFIKQKDILSKIQFPSKMLKAFKSTHSNLIPTFSCVMAKKDVFKNNHRRVGYKPFLKEIGTIEGLDLDYPEDFEIIDSVYMHKKQQSCR